MGRKGERVTEQEMPSQADWLWTQLKETVALADERLAEIKRLKEQLQVRSTKTNCCGCSDDICTLDHGRAELAEARAKALKDALQRIADESSDGGSRAYARVQLAKQVEAPAGTGGGGPETATAHRPASSPVEEPRGWTGTALLERDFLRSARELAMSLEEEEREDAEMTKDGAPILVWAWHDAPQEYRDLSRHGGDEDWVAIVSPNYGGYEIPWLEHGGFGVSEISEHQLVNGWTVYIGAHA